MSERFTESTVEDAALAWLAELGWAVKHGPEIAPPDCRDGLGSGRGELFAERKDGGGTRSEE